MSNSFLTCTNCGQRSADTKRCKHCGQVFGRAPQQASDAGSKRSWRPLLAVIGLVAVIAIGWQRWWPGPAVAPFAPLPETTAVAAPAETAVVSAPTQPAPVPKELSPAPADTARPVAPP